MKSFKQLINEVYVNKFKGRHGPLANASDWIGKSSLEKLATHPEIHNSKNHTTLYSGEIHNVWDETKPVRHVAILSHGEPSESNFKHGYNKPHDWYTDNGRGNRAQDSTQLTITGHAHIHPDGKVTYHGKADPKKTHTLMVYK